MSSRDRDNTRILIHRRVQVLAASMDLTLALADLDHIAAPGPADDYTAPRFLIVCQRTQDARAPLPGAASYDGPTVSGGKAALTQPERLADQLDRTQADRTRLDDTLRGLKRLTRPDGIIVNADHHRDAITTGCYTLRRIVDAWYPHEPNAKDQREASEATDQDNWCAHHRTAGYMEPTHRITNMGGTLDVKMPLCNPCVDQVRRNGKLPSAEWMQRQASRGKPDRVKA
jgi:hypothetical protein